MIDRWLLAAATALVSAIGLWLVRRQSPLHPATFGVGHALLIGTFFPILTSFVEPITWRNVRGAPEELILGVEADYLAFSVGLFAAVVLAWCCGWLRSASRAPTPPASVSFRDGLIAWVLVITGALLYTAYVARVGLSALVDSDDFARKYLESAGLGPLLFGLNFVILGCLWAEGGSLRSSQRLLFRLVAAAVAIWSISFIAVRSYAVWLFLGYLYLACRRRGVQLRHVRPRLVLLLLTAYAGAEGISLLRANWGDGLGDAVHSLAAQPVASRDVIGAIVGGSELSHPFMTSMELASHEEPGALAGSSYLDTLLTFVPLALLPERPQTLAQRFVTEYYPGLAARGGGAAFTFVGEAWWNFGPLIGPLMIGLATGLVLFWIERRGQLAPHGLTARLTPYLLFLVLGLHRCAAATTAKQVGLAVLPVLLLSAFATLSWAALAAPIQRRRTGSTTTRIARA